MFLNVDTSFYINIPIGAFSMLLIYLLLPVHPQSLASLPFRQKLDQIDFLGAMFFLPYFFTIRCSDYRSMGCLLLALQWGGTIYLWNSSRIIGLFLGFGGLIIIFVFIQVKRGDNAMFPLSILRQRTIAFAVLFSFFFGASFFIMVYYSANHLRQKLILVPIYFQAIKGSSPVKSGLQLIPFMVSMVVISLIVGGILQLWGYYTPFIIAGAVIFTTGAGLMTLFSVDQPNWRSYGFSIVAGGGCGFSMQNVYLAVQAVLPQDTQPIATAAVIFMQTFAFRLILMYD